MSSVEGTRYFLGNFLRRVTLEGLSANEPSHQAAIITALAGASARPWRSKHRIAHDASTALVVGDPAAALDAATMPAASLPSAARAGWDGFRAAHGAEWAISIDRRSGAPLLVEGRGNPMADRDAGATIDSIAATLAPVHRGQPIAAHGGRFRARARSRRVGPAAAGRLADRRSAASVAGVPVAGERYLFTIGHGNLISFGSPRWSRIDVSATPDLDEAAARARLTTYMGLTKDDAVEDFERPRLQFVPLRAGAAPTPGSGYYRGAIGSGYSSALVWRFSVRVAGDPGTVGRAGRRPQRRDPLLRRRHQVRAGSKGASTRSRTIRSVPTAASRRTTRCRSPPSTSARRIPSRPRRGCSPARPPGPPPRRRLTGPYVTISRHLRPDLSSR